MVKHDGQIVEYIIRKNGFGISDLATGLNVNRRTIYNYFQKEKLKYDVIYRIGMIIRHDFSVEFPELFASGQFEFNIKRNDCVNSLIVSKNEINWKEKFNDLLKAYNNIKLLKQVEPV